jgi:hypothetical protein
LFLSFFKEFVVSLSTFILPFADLLTLANSFSMSPFLVASSSHSFIRFLNSFWTPFAISSATSTLFYHSFNSSSLFSNCWFK